ncbi:MAG: glycosyltransferase family 2 protein [Synechococcales cyanobacterium C42_A2020_086]|jgi:glycosyltransferase involved in cell wall biosynthesis|nr:glycosyltransferase family 2 protein [Synechococcales cyanobacterium C42_A2020_086]
MASIDVLIPTYNRAAALAVTLTSLCAQSFQDFRVIISDQTEEYSAVETGEVQAAIRVLQVHGQEVQTHRHLPRRGIAEQRQFLLDQATAPYVLYLDDDLILEPWLIGNLWRMMQEQDCGFVGSAMIGLSFRTDVRPQQQQIEFWQGAVQPEIVAANTPQWNRYQLHNAANVYHVQQQLQITPDQPRLYRVAWVAGCILYNHAKLRDVGGFEFWRELPLNHCGEDVLVQLRLLAQYGGCGMLPSGAYHQELPTTIPDRHIDAPHLLPILPLAGEIHA